MPTLLDDYLARVGLASAGPANLDTLRRLHAAHVAAIPFENLDILLGRGVSLELERLGDKLIAQRRGGYCFEQNTLFLAVLRELGFSATPMEARVRSGTTAVRPRTHMVLMVEIDGARWLADVGFGGDGLLEPLRFGTESAPTCGLVHRVIAEGCLVVLQLRRGGDWEDQYAFLPEPVHAVDFEVGNWYTSTYPQSPFVRTLTVQRTLPDVRYILRYPTFSEIRESGVVTRQIERGDLIHLLRSVFTIDLPEDTIFPAIDGTAQPAPL